jgi:Na+-transporting NADH:ubiquinone oxidoreductase subunit A
MISVNIKKGFGLNISGEPSHKVEVLEKPTRVALLPERIPFVKPRLKVKIGDQVKVGTPIFEDKRNPDMIFLSPGGGEIIQINFGPRRVVKKVVVALDHDEAYEELPTFSETQVDSIERKELVRVLMASGLWPFFRELPFRDVADPDFTPPAIIVNLDATEPFLPVPEVYLKGYTDLFEFGLKILRKLSQTVFISTSADNAFVLQQLSGSVTHTYKGNYPANDPGVLLYHIKKTPDTNRTWYINGQDVLLLARLLKTGSYPVERTVSLGGNLVNNKTHLLTRAGVPLNHIILDRAEISDAARYIVGGIFRGYIGNKDSYMGFYETSLTLISEGAEKEFFGFARPGFKKPSRSRAFLSFFNKSPMPMDCNFHGEERACINCGYCAEVCPVDILPQFTYKSILTDEIEEALAHGLLDCVECGLCTYVCPCKIELCDTLKNTKKAYYLEQI